MQKMLKTIAEVRKALSTAGLVAATIAATAGVPNSVREAALDVVAVLGAGGITWRIPNKPAE